MKAVLLTPLDAAGKCGLVAELELPQFAKPPRVLFWGERCFVHDYVEPHPVAYVEAFAYWVEVAAHGEYSSLPLLIQQRDNARQREADALRDLHVANDEALLQKAEADQQRARAEAAEAELADLRKRQAPCEAEIEAWRKNLRHAWDYETEEEDEGLWELSEDQVDAAIALMRRAVQAQDGGA